jgi:hypothetical protein
MFIGLTSGIALSLLHGPETITSNLSISRLKLLYKNNVNSCKSQGFEIIEKKYTKYLPVLCDQWIEAKV